jgi:hypothetical protein
MARHIRKCRLCRNDAIYKRSLCKACRGIERKRKKVEKGVATRFSALVCALPGFKWCSACKTFKHLNDFGPRYDKPHLMRSRCKQCEYRDSSENDYKYERAYKERHSERLAIKHKEKGLIEREVLSDNYIKAICRRQLAVKGVELTASEINPALITAKRISIQSYRLLRTLK